VKAISFSLFGIENLRAEERPSPPLGARDVRLKMKAVSLNYRDLLMVRGAYDPRQLLPLVPCSDGVGEVIELGAEVTSLRAGDRVAPLFAQRWLSGEPTKKKIGSTLGGPLAGVLAEEVVAPAESVVRVPAHMSDEEAATLPCAALTAWSALVAQGGLEPGRTVLVEGTGGVSIFALQIARLAGARVIVTSHSDDKLERAKALGAFHGINYAKTPAWGREAKAVAGDRGIDHVVEVGGGKTIVEALKAVRPGGTISVIGVLSGVAAEIPLTSILMNNVRLQGVFVGHGESFARMNEAFAEAKLRPVVDRVFGFDEARQAFEFMASGSHFGKIVVRVAS
jgi:NADPH:quinone reductase-like Zn-dependent oxidoreductase